MITQAWCNSVRDWEVAVLGVRSPQNMSGSGSVQVGTGGS
jgi:hypothetical protein